jgi:hypothetical protein
MNASIDAFTQARFFTSGCAGLMTGRNDQNCRCSGRIRYRLVAAALAAASGQSAPAFTQDSKPPISSITDFTDSAVAPALSPDGRMVAFYRSNTTMSPNVPRIAKFGKHSMRQVFEPVPRPRLPPMLPKDDDPKTVPGWPNFGVLLTGE